jgi:hypothetical protein
VSPDYLILRFEEEELKQRDSHFRFGPTLSIDSRNLNHINDVIDIIRFKGI